MIVLNKGILRHQQIQGESELITLLFRPSDAMAFRAAPESINGRLAMLGFVAALEAEFNTQQPIAAQFSEGAPAILVSAVVFSIASIIPLVQGFNLNVSGPFTPDVSDTWLGQQLMQQPLWNPGDRDLYCNNSRSHGSTAQNSTGMQILM